MGKKLYVGNLSYHTTDSALLDVFAQYGAVTSAKIIVDRQTGRSKGFGFVEMGSDQEALDAISGLDGQSIEGRNLRVSEARPQEQYSQPHRGGPHMNRHHHSQGM